MFGSEQWDNPNFRPSLPMDMEARLEALWLRHKYGRIIAMIIGDPLIVDILDMMTEQYKPTPRQYLEGWRADKDSVFSDWEQPQADVIAFYEMRAKRHEKDGENAQFPYDEYYKTVIEKRYEKPKP